MTDGKGPGAGRAFVDASRSYLAGEYLPKIRRCLERLDDDDLWWRPNPECNAVGNLLLHLAGNIRQWVVAGIGQEPDVRQRDAEFEAAGEVDRRALLALLEHALADVDRVLASLVPERLAERREIQGRDVSVLEALYHAVEHFAMHTGQIIYITKLRTGSDLGFYAFEDGRSRPTWT